MYTEYHSPANVNTPRRRTGLIKLDLVQKNHFNSGRLGIK